MGFKDQEVKRTYRSTWQKRKRATDKVAVHAFLGGCCAICKFDDGRALQIDHIHGGGTKEWKGKTGSQKVAMVYANPTAYQLLCANCNWIKRFERGEHRT